MTRERAIQFQAWPKISRWNRDVIISEKIDGTNAAVGIRHLGGVDGIDHIQQWAPGTYTIGEEPLPDDPRVSIQLFDDDERFGIVVDKKWVVYAQSRTRLINPEFDNHGFAKWVRENASELANTLGEGLHFGEWWGSGIQRGYGLTKGEKRFSLFNTPRYGDAEKFDLTRVTGLSTVPIIYQGLLSDKSYEDALDQLRSYGSLASPGYMNPEGIVIFHTAANTAFKVTLKDDQSPKGLVTNG